MDQGEEMRWKNREEEQEEEEESQIMVEGIDGCIVRVKGEVAA